MPNPYDQMCRFLAKLMPQLFLLWLLRPGTPQLRFVEWLDTHNLPFPGSPERFCDTVAHVYNDDAAGLPWAIVLEFQTHPETDMILRLVVYQTLVRWTFTPTSLRGDRFEVGSLLVHLTGQSQPRLHSVWPAAHFDTQVRPWVVNLSEHSAAATLTGIAAQTIPPVALAFVPLMQGGADPAIVTEWKRVGRLAPEAWRPSVAAGAVVFAELTQCKPLWQAELKEWNMVKSEIVEEWKAEARKEGEDNGYKKGEDKGRILGAYALALDLGQTPEQARQLIVKKYGVGAIAVLEQASATEKT
jgi:hypothetical protein